MDLLYKENKTPDDINELLSQNKNLIYHVLKCNNLLDNCDAESLGWEALWDAISTFSIYSDTKFSTYACTCITNRIFNELRKEKAQKRQHIEVTFEDYLSVDYADDFCMTELINRIYKVFDSYIKNISGINRNVLLVWYSSNFTYSIADIAKVADTSPSYVGRVLCAFRAYLSTILQKEGYL